MTNYKTLLATMASLFFIGASTTFATNNSSVEFFASNNTQEINLQSAYARLTGEEQFKLESTIINTLQKNYIDQGKFENILGTYRMSTDKNITADNTELFTTSPFQQLSEDKIFKLARELAKSLNQDSVAVLIPNHQTVGDIILSFNAPQPSIPEAIDAVHNKLPPQYSNGFSLHLLQTCKGFDNAKVAKVEWLGNKIKFADVKKAFPTEKIDYQNGTVFLVYKDGHKEQI